MHTTLEAIIELDGMVHLLEPFKLVKPVRALITILADEPKQPPAPADWCLTVTAERGNKKFNNQPIF